VTTHVLILADAVGCALLAAWLYVRFPGRAPGASGTILHACALYPVLAVIPRLTYAVSGGGDGAVRKLASNFLVVVPGLTYFWLVSLWLMLLAMRGARARY
jgi:hypothetical protein